jgi:MFS family permease
MDNNRLARLQLWILSVTSGVSQFSIAMINLAIIYHLRARFNLSAQMIGIAASIYTFTYFLFCMVLGPISARLKPRYSVEMSMLGMAASVFLLLAAKAVWVVFVALGFYGLFMSLLWPPIESWLTRGKEGKELNATTSVFNFSWSFGAGLSPFIAGLLVEKSTTLPLISGIIVFLAVYVLIAITTRMIPGIRAMKSEHQTNHEEIRDDRSTPLRYLCWAGVVTGYIAISVIMTIFPLYALDKLHLSESRVGLLLLIRGFTTCMMFVYLGKVSWWQFKKPVILGSQIFLALICIAGTQIDTLAAYSVLFFLFGAGYAMIYTLSIFHGASGSINRSQRMVVHEIMLTIGAIVGSSLGGTVYQHFSFDRVLFYCALVVMIPVVFEVLRIKGYRKIVVLH